MALVRLDKKQFFNQLTETVLGSSGGVDKVKYAKKKDGSGGTYFIDGVATFKITKNPKTTQYFMYEVE